MLSQIMMISLAVLAATPLFQEEPAEDRVSIALNGVTQQLHLQVDTMLEEMPAKDRAALNNSLAWYDTSATALQMTRGHRGHITSLSGRFLAHDAHPQLPPIPDEIRAKAFFDEGGLGRELLNLGPEDEMVLVSVSDLGKNRRFVFQQYWQQIPLHEGTYTLDLDAEGHLRAMGGFAVPNLVPATGKIISTHDAIDVAIAGLEASDDPTWEGSEPLADSVEAVVVNLFATAGKDLDRLAWKVTLLPADEGMGHYVALVDQLDGSLLHGENQLALHDIRVDWQGGGHLDYSTHATTCPPTITPSATTTINDWDESEVTRTLCEANDFFRTRGSELGHGDMDYWLFRSPEGTGAPHLDINIIGPISLSIGKNNYAGQIELVRGAARAEILGHELGHSMCKNGNHRINTRGLEGDGIEEHICDVLGIFLERRLGPAHQEDPDLLGDDCHTQMVISDLRNSQRPCINCNGEPACGGTCGPDCGPSPACVNKPWRSFAHPADANGGWCTGSLDHDQMVYNTYDAYHRDTWMTYDSYVPGHVNLGIGNRAIASLMRDSGPTSESLGGIRVNRLGQETVERLFLRAYTNINGSVDWASYAQAWADAARDLFGAAMVSHQEKAVRSAFSGVRVWSTSTQMDRQQGTEIRKVRTPYTTRPGIASLRLAEGMERTFIFYTDTTTGAIHYMWRDEALGGPYADAPTGIFSETHTIPGAHTRYSPAVVGSDLGLYLVWNQIEEGEDVGLMQGVFLSRMAESANYDTAWEPFPPGNERPMKGAPSLALWAPPRSEVDCEILRTQFPGASFPFRTTGAMGLVMGDCFEVYERIDPRLLIPDMGPYLLDRFRDVLDSDPVRSIPTGIDAAAPRVNPGEALNHRMDLLPMVAEEPDLVDGLRNLADGVGDAFSEVFDAKNPHLGPTFTLDLGMGAEDIDPEIERFSLIFRAHNLMVAFRDEEGGLRTTRYQDTRPNAETPLMDADPNPVDPTLAVVDVEGARIPGQYLYVLYNKRALGEEGAWIPNRLTYRVITEEPAFPLLLGAFTPARFIDDIRVNGTYRYGDYRLTRTKHTPVAAGSTDTLHLFVVALYDTGLDMHPRDNTDVPTDDNRIRYTRLRVAANGTLQPGSERPVVLTNTGLGADISAGLAPQAGAAFVTRNRGQLRYYYPTAAEMTVRSKRIQ